MSGILLQIGGPMQSWGDHSHFAADRDTATHPTRSGLIGLVASALGIPRQETRPDGAPGRSGIRFADLEALRFTVRVDRPGVRVRDFHTVGGGYPRHRTVPTASGTRRSVETATIVSDRYYLADAVFTVAVTADGPGPEELLATCGNALARPHWPLYLGRRSCPPAGMLLIRDTSPDPLTDLFEHLPLARVAPGKDAPPPDVRYLADAPFPESDRSGSDAVTELNDSPERPTSLDRRYRIRKVFATVRPFHGPCGGWGTEYLTTLAEYLNSPRYRRSS